LEDISDIQPLNLFANATGGGNYGDMKCKKVELPVGSHIYDARMKCNDPSFRTNCDNSSWWLEEKCSPSYKYTKEILPSLPKIPGGKPLGTTTETFINNNNNNTTYPLTNTRNNNSIIVPCLFGLLLLLLLIYIVVSFRYTSSF